MATSDSALGSMITSFQADTLISSEENPLAAKIASAMALFGVVCVTRKLYKHSQSLAKYCLHAYAPLSSVTLTARYGAGATTQQDSQDTPRERSWAMILNSVDQLGNAYAQQLASLGFDLILSGPPIDEDRMQGQASIIQQQHNVRTSVLLFDYQTNTEDSYQEIAKMLGEYDVCVLVNNQTYTVPFDVARKDLSHQSIEACVQQINKHINCSLMIQQLIVPKMLTRHENCKEIRSAILTLKTHANALFEQQLAQTFKFPILRCAMEFNANLSRSMHEQYQNQGVDVMQAFAPFVAFESWLRQGLVLEAIMQERMLASHVRAILNHLRMGYAESDGSWENALCLTDGNRMLRMRFMVSGPMVQGRFIERYAQMAEERREHDVYQPEVLKTEEVEESKSQVSTDDQVPDKEVARVEVCEKEIQTSEVNIKSFRKMVEAQQTELETNFEEEKETIETIDMISMEEIGFVEDEFTFEPQKGEEMDVYNERRVYQAEMSQNSKLLLDANKQSMDMLIRQATKGREHEEIVMTELQFESCDQSPRVDEGETMEVHNEKRVNLAVKSSNMKAELAMSKQSTMKLVKQIEEQQEAVHLKKSLEATSTSNQLTETRNVQEMKKLTIIEDNSSGHAPPIELSNRSGFAPDSSRKNAMPIDTILEEVPEAVKTPPPRNVSSVPAEQLVNRTSDLLQTTPEPARSKSPESPKFQEPELEMEHEEEVLFKQIEPVSAPPPAQEKNDQQMPEMDLEPKVTSKVQEPSSIGTEAEVPQAETKPEVTSPEPTVVQESPAPVSEEEKIEVPQEETKPVAMSPEPATIKASPIPVVEEEIVEAPQEERQIEVPEMPQLPELEAESQEKPDQIISLIPSSNTLKHDKSSEALREKLLSPPASEAGKQGNDDLLNTSANPTEETKDTTGTANTDLLAPKPRPYNRLSEDRAKSMSSKSNDDSRIKDTEANEEQDSPIIQPPSLQQQKVTEEGEDDANPFDPAELVPKPQHSSDRANAATPAFKDNAGAKVGIPVVSSPDTGSREPSRNDSSSSPARRGTSPFMRVALSPMVDPASLSNLNKSQVSSHSQSRRSHISSEGAREGEWKSTTFTQIGIKDAKPQHQNTKSFDAVLAAPVARGSDASAASRKLSENQGVAIVTQTLEAAPIEEKKERSDSDVCDSSSPEPRDTAAQPVEEMKQQNPDEQLLGADRQLMKHRSENMLEATPRSDISSGGADMAELKMALGGLSDRSMGAANDTGSFTFQPTADLVEENDVIFSDEGSNDSFNFPEDDEAQQKIWQQPKIDQKASLQFMRATTLRLAKGDETDQAIQKVLQNLVNHYLTDFDPDEVESDQNLTVDQKLEKKNQSLIYELATCLPFVKLAPGRYLVGTEVRQIQIKGRGVLVRTGGGYMYLSEFLLHYAKSECLKLGLMILKQNKSLKTVVLNLLKRQQNSENGQKEWIKRCPKTLNDQFGQLVTEVRTLESKVQKQRQRKSTKNNSLNKSYNSQLNLSMRSSDSGKRKSQPMYINNRSGSGNRDKLITPVRSPVKQPNTMTMGASFASPSERVSDRLSQTMTKKTLNNSPGKSGASASSGSSSNNQGAATATSGKKLGDTGYKSQRHVAKQSPSKLLGASGYSSQRPRPVESPLKNQLQKSSASPPKQAQQAQRKTFDKKSALFSSVRSKHLKTTNTGGNSPTPGSAKKKKASTLAQSQTTPISISSLIEEAKMQGNESQQQPPSQQM